MIAEYALLPRTILQALVGYWAYDDDPFSAGATQLLFPTEFKPDAPHLFVGLGVKLGL